MNELRAFKSDAEVANMRIAGKASGRAHTNAMRRRFSSEKELAAFLEYQFKENGCDSSAYVPVVAGGEVTLPRALICMTLTVAERSKYSLREK